MLGWVVSRVMRYANVTAAASGGVIIASAEGQNTHSCYSSTCNFCTSSSSCDLGTSSSSCDFCSSSSRHFYRFRPQTCTGKNKNKRRTDRHDQKLNDTQNEFTNISTTNRFPRDSHREAGPEPMSQETAQHVAVTHMKQNKRSKIGWKEGRRGAVGVCVGGWGGVQPKNAPTSDGHRSKTFCCG